MNDTPPQYNSSILNTNITQDASRILVVDDEKVICEILADFLSLEGWDVITASDGVSALARLDEQPCNMIISDLKMPKMDGLELLENVQANHEDILTIIMTGFGTVETAIEAMKKGAYDYILKPFKVEEVVHIVQRGIEKQRLVSENIRLREIIALHELSEQLQATLSLSEVIDSTLKAAVNSLACDFAGLYIKNKGYSDFKLAGHFVKTNDPPKITLNAELDIDLVISETNKNSVILSHYPQANHFFKRPPNNLSTFMAAPLMARQQTIGLLTAYSCTSKFRFTEGQRKLLFMLSSRSAAAIDNAELYNNLQQTFRQTILALARALEAMDKYTAGHSDRVTGYSRIIAEELGESSHQIELVTQAGMLHDIGKLGCHSNLNKPGQLTDEEYEIFKLHPGFGKEILEPITFLQPLIPAVNFHHERWDGNGYPQKLKGNEIPRIARILSIADAYDAMTSNRAYRKALKHSIAIAEIKRCSGSQFDPTFVDAFFRGIERYRLECKNKNIIIPD